MIGRTIRHALAYCAFAIGLLWLSPAVTAQQGPPRPGSTPDPLTSFATQAGVVIGGAEYCGADKDRLTQFAVMVEARINLMSQDEVRRVLARTQFKNLQTANRGKRPNPGCEKALTSFNTSFRELARAR